MIKAVKIDTLFEIHSLFRALVEKVPSYVNHVFPLESNWEEIPWESGTNLRTFP